MSPLYPRNGVCFCTRCPLLSYKGFPSFFPFFLRLPDSSLGFSEVVRWEDWEQINMCTMDERPHQPWEILRLSLLGVAPKGDQPDGGPGNS